MYTRHLLKRFALRFSTLTYIIMFVPWRISFVSCTVRVSADLEMVCRVMLATHSNSLCVGCWGPCIRNYSCLFDFDFTYKHSRTKYIENCWCLVYFFFLLLFFCYPSPWLRWKKGRGEDDAEKLARCWDAVSEIVRFCLTDLHTNIHELSTLRTVGVEWYR